MLKSKQKDMLLVMRWTVYIYEVILEILPSRVKHREGKEPRFYIIYVTFSLYTAI